jgi:hypothetical protein
VGGRYASFLRCSRSDTWTSSSLFGGWTAKHVGSGSRSARRAEESDCIARTLARRWAAASRCGKPVASIAPAWKADSIIVITSARVDADDAASGLAWAITVAETCPARASSPAMTHDTITVTIRATGAQTQLLVKQGPDELMIARLGPSSWAHRDALPRMMEGLALWFQCHVRVVLCVASEHVESSTGLVDGLGCGISNLHFDVDVHRVHERRRGIRLRGLGDLRALRREAERGTSR